MAERVKVVAGVKVSKLEPKTFKAALDQLKLDDSGTLDDKVKRMVEHFRKHTAKGSLADCSECGGDSDVNFKLGDRPCCPYCGVGDDEEEEQPKKVAAVVVQLHPPGKFTETHLNQSVERINRLKLDAAKNIWELGHEVKKNYDSELWKCRKTDKGQIAYRNWKQFCTGELGMSATHAYNLMNIAAAFTREQIASLGATKLGVALQLPEPMRSKLVEMAEKGATVRELQEAAPKKPEKPAKSPEKKTPDDAAPVVLRIGRRTLRFLTRVKDSATKDHRAAKRVEEDPWCVEESFNGFKTTYKLKKDAEGSLVLIVERVKV